VLFEATQAVKAPSEAEEDLEPSQLLVDAAHYRRLLKCLSILETGYAEYGAGEDAAELL
jgi:hypothetical protein